MLPILALEKDLFFAVKMRDTLRHHAMEVTAVRSLAAFEEGLHASKRPALVIVDTATRGVDWEAAIQAARKEGYIVLAFGSHMDLEARAKALQAGAQKVVANSKFSSDMAGLIQRLLAQPAGATASIESDEETPQEK
jgi:DNA-binding response OmpR family regulator